MGIGTIDGDHAAHAAKCHGARSSLAACDGMYKQGQRAQLIFKGQSSVLTDCGVTLSGHSQVRSVWRAVQLAVDAWSRRIFGVVSRVLCEKKCSKSV